MIYQPDFSSCWAKVERAKQHCDVLERQIDAAFGIETNRARIGVEYNSDSGYHIFRVTALPPEDLTLRFALIIGDVVLNLRAALDHLVWQLALFGCGGQEPPKPYKVAFPLWEKPSPTALPEEFGAKGPLEYVASCHRAIVERHQPYHGWHRSPLPHPLLRLRVLSNIDKHRLVRPVLLRSTAIYIRPRVFRSVGGKLMKYETDGFGQPLKLGAEVFRATVRPSSLQRHMQWAGTIWPFVCLPDVPDDVDISVIATMPDALATTALDAMGRCVVQAIRDFEQLF